MKRADRFDRGNADHQARQFGAASDTEPTMRDITNICNGLGKRFTDAEKVTLLAAALQAYEGR